MAFNFQKFRPLRYIRNNAAGTYLHFDAMSAAIAGQGRVVKHIAAKTPKRPAYRGRS